MLAAAHLSETCHADPDLLVSSPYIGAEHHLDLTSVPKNSKQLAIALQTFRPLVENYPSEPYSESFNWQEVIDQLPLDFSGVFYCIAFYSTLRHGVDNVRLNLLDALAHAEANHSGGLLKYWWQDPRDQASRKNLATCVWTSRDHASKSGRLPMHAKAMGATMDSYEKWNVERYHLKISPGHKWSLERITL